MRPPPPKLGLTIGEQIAGIVVVTLLIMGLFTWLTWSWEW